MSKKMLINASHPEENRVATVVDGVLSELDIELAGQEQARGNIYKAVVVRVETGLQAAFVDYGAEKLGFLQISEIHPDLYPAREDTSSRPRITDILHRGQNIMVQVVKEERGNKGAALTTFLSLPGRYMVLMPDSTTKGVSRKIADEVQRKTLKKTMAELKLPDQMGYIVRTAGIGKEKDELKRDFDYLVRLYAGIVQRKEQVKAPAQLYQESSLAIRSIRDYFTADMDEVLIDDEKVYNDAKDFFALVMPEHAHLVKRHRERRPIFSRYQVEEQIDTLSRNQVFLPSGGSIVIDPTEALVAIDVNSGKLSSESGIETTALKTNLEAAGEIGRQLRLRDLGGLIVIDFIDMRERKHNREVEQELLKALKSDKARVAVGRISQFGLLEMSRQRIKQVLSVGAYQECAHCHGLGKVKSIEAQAVSFLRQVHTAAAKGQVGQVEARVPFEVANYLLNNKRSTISRLENLLDLKITILGQSDLRPGDLALESFKREKIVTDASDSAPVSHANQIDLALADARMEQEKISAEKSAEKDATIDKPPAATETSEESSPAPKKRRRRRKKPASGAATAPADTPHSASQQDHQSTAVEPVEQEPQPDTGTQQAAESAAEEQQSSTSDTQVKPKRRSRRPRGTGAKTTSVPQAPALEVADDKSSEAEKNPSPDGTPLATPTTMPADSSTAKPTRKPRKRTAKAAATAETRPPAATEEKVGNKAPEDQAKAPATKPQRKKRSPAAKKPDAPAAPQS